MSAPARKPSRLRFAFLVFLGVYPVVTLLIYLIGTLTPDWAVWQRTLVLVPIVVSLMVYLIIPFIQTRLRRWI